MIRKNYVVVEGGGLSLWDSGLHARAPVRNRSRLSDGDRPCSRALPIADSFPAVAKLRSNNGVKAGVERLRSLENVDPNCVFVDLLALTGHGAGDEVAEELGASARRRKRRRCHHTVKMRAKGIPRGLAEWV